MMVAVQASAKFFLCLEFNDIVWLLKVWFFFFSQLN